MIETAAKHYKGVSRGGEKSKSGNNTRSSGGIALIEKKRKGASGHEAERRGKSKVKSGVMREKGGAPRINLKKKEKRSTSIAPKRSSKLLFKRNSGVPGVQGNARCSNSSVISFTPGKEGTRGDWGGMAIKAKMSGCEGEGSGRGGRRG